MLAGKGKTHLAASQADAVHLDQARTRRWQPEAERRDWALTMHQPDDQGGTAPPQLQVEKHRPCPHPFCEEGSGGCSLRQVDRERLACGRPAGEPPTGKGGAHAPFPSATGPRLTDVAPHDSPFIRASAEFCQLLKNLGVFPPGAWCRFHERPADHALAVDEHVGAIGEEALLEERPVPAGHVALEVTQ